MPRYEEMKILHLEFIVSMMYVYMYLLPRIVHSNFAGTEERQIFESVDQCQDG